MNPTRTTEASDPRGASDRLRDPTVSLVIPTYARRAQARRSVAEALEFLRELPGETAELIVVDDGSLPEEGLDASDLPEGVVFVRHPTNLGKGAAVRSGVGRAQGSMIIVTDCDLPFSLEPVPTTLRWLREGADLVLGDRHHPDSECAIEVTSARRLSSFVFTQMVSKLVGLELADTQCGYKGYRAEAAKFLFSHLETKSFAFEVELLLRARQAGYQARLQPLSLVNDQDSTVRLWKHGPQVFLDTLRIAWRGARGRYD